MAGYDEVTTCYIPIGGGGGNCQGCTGSGGYTPPTRDCAGKVNGTAIPSPCGCIGGTTGVTECVVDTLMTSDFVKNAKAMCALAKLMNNSFFKNTLNNFIGVNKPIDLTFKLEPLAPESGFIRYGTAIPNPGNWNSNNIDLTLNESIIDSLSSIEVAFTLLHEGIHAEIFRKLLSIHGPSNLNSQNFPSLFEAYRIHNNYQHEFIANYYTDIIGTALWEYDNKKFDLSFYKAYSYNGLERTITYTTFSTTKKSDIASKTTSLLLNRNKSNCNDL